MAEQHRGEWTIASPVPLMDIRTIAHSSSSRAGNTAGTDRQGRQRLEVLRQVETRLRDIRREVDERQRCDGVRATGPLNHHRRRRQPVRRQSDGVVRSPGCSTETQTEVMDDNGRTVKPEVIVSDDDHSSGDRMDRSMERWMEEQDPSGDHLEMEPTVLDELFRGASDDGRRERSARMERSKSLPPAWN